MVLNVLLMLAILDFFISSNNFSLVMVTAIPQDVVILPERDIARTHFCEIAQFISLASINLCSNPKLDHDYVISPYGEYVSTVLKYLHFRFGWPFS